jgi:NAD(P)-dependent dehydrogenase (short-subunit alcohol dehydrogenase family)
MGERLKGKVAIVTGAGSVLAGIGNGKATAIVLGDQTRHRAGGRRMYHF